MPLPVYEEARRPNRRKRVAIAAAAGAGLLLLPFAGYVAVSAGSDSGGAETPEAAVQALFDAIGDEDVLGVMDTVLPGERRSLGEPLQDIVDELGRLEILSDDLDLGDVPGLDLEFTDLELATDQVADGIAVVALTGGTVEGEVVLEELPLGDLLLDLGFDGEQPSGTERASDPVGDDVRIATVEEDGRWYVSLWFTVAEAARTEAGAPAPDPAQAIEPSGSESPDDVLDDLLAAASALDLEGVLAMLPPSEARALHVYAPLFLADAQAALDEARGTSGLSFAIEASEYEVDRDGDRATVIPTAFDLRVAADGEEITASVADGCATVEVAGEAEEACAGDPADALADAGLEDLPALSGLSDLDVGFEVVEEEGRWYLSPTATLLQPFVAVLQALDADAVEDLVEAFEAGFSFGF
jgi:hypothetical protein